MSKSNPLLPPLPGIDTPEIYQSRLNPQRYQLETATKALSRLVKAKQDKAFDIMRLREIFKRHPEDADVFRKLAAIQSDLRNVSSNNPENCLQHTASQQLLKSKPIESMVRHLSHYRSWDTLVLLGKMLGPTRQPAIPPEARGKLDYVRAYYAEAATKHFPMHFRVAAGIPGQLGLKTLMAALPTHDPV